VLRGIELSASRVGPISWP